MDKETVLQAVDYTNTEAEKHNKIVRIFIAIAMVLICASTVLRDTAIYNSSDFVRFGTDFAQGAAIGIMLMSVIISSRHGAKIRAF